MSKSLLLKPKRGRIKMKNNIDLKINIDWLALRQAQGDSTEFCQAELVEAISIKMYIVKKQTSKNQKKNEPL